MIRARGKIALGIILLILLIAAVETPKVLQKLHATGPDIPTARVARGALEMKVYTTGELRPSQSAMVVAPPVGATLQIVHIAKSGTFVNQGDVVVEFDPSEQEFNLEQARSQLEEADQQITKMKADIAVGNAEDNVSLLTAQFDVRRSELQVKGNDLLGAIEARKNVLNLEEAKRRLEQLQRDIKSRQSSNQADLVVQAVARAKATLAMKLAQQNIDNMTLRAPIGGIVVLGQNLDALYSGGSIMISSGMDIPEFREGDQTYAGRTVAQIQDVAQMEILSKVTETDRGSLESGQVADVRVDSLPTMRFTGKIKSLAGMASSSSQTVSDMFSSTKSFDTTFEFDPKGMKISPGVSVRVEIRGTNLKDALSVPRQALFTMEGKPVVYWKHAQNWEAHPIQIKYLTESRAVIEGIAEGTEVALVNPNLQKGKAGRKAGPLSSILGGVTP
jgi:multidrug resistance efflux pump